MSKKLLLISLLLFVPGRASAHFDDAPWKTVLVKTSTVDTVAYADTFYIWVDKGALAGPDSIRVSWQDTQRSIRRACAKCPPTDTWGEKEYNRLWAARESGDKFNFEPHRLEWATFLIVNFDMVGEPRLIGHPLWRADDSDQVEVTLRDGRTLRSFGPILYPEPKPSLAMPGIMVDLCWPIRTKLGPQYIFNRSERSQLWPYPNFQDRPEENIFFVPIDNGGRDFTDRDIVSMRLFFLGGWVDLQSQAAPASRAAGP